MNPMRKQSYCTPREDGVKIAKQGFRFSSKNEAERISESVRRAAIFDSVPRPPEVQFRKRAAGKDIVPALRFQPRNNTERVIDYIRKEGISQLQSLSVLNEIRFAFCYS
eukprot:TRINITY_DN2961_c0_g2_i1.p2 TRINITY_DN2961_c0_g2~~TRINITY_DN2961_c0_g2_i1.p2  ORF type:complete len:118 (-),score=14.28 TRINITY_DN2961_c0_g2_i1:412-738(-)